MISPLRKRARRACCSTGFRLLQKMLFPKASGHPKDNIRRDSIFQTKGSASSRSYLDSTRYHQTVVKSCSCKSWTNATSSLISTMHLET